MLIEDSSLLSPCLATSSLWRRESSDRGREAPPAKVTCIDSASDSSGVLSAMLSSSIGLLSSTASASMANFWIENRLVFFRIDKLETDGINTEHEIKFGPFLTKRPKFRAKIYQLLLVARLIFKVGSSSALQSTFVNSLGSFLLFVAALACKCCRHRL
ncbi:hypothetical protein HG531_013256 [Fusarium graminearum]|nr:hypothetical protein HG531_013256 [Fusarium graminearum]